MKLLVQIYVPDGTGKGVLTLQRDAGDVLTALIEAEIALQMPDPVDRSMLRIQNAEPEGFAATIFVAYVRNGVWEPYCYPMHFGA